MDFSGQYIIAAPPQAVWDGLNNPHVLKACIPGCEKMEKTSETDFAATATLKIGPVRATFRGKVTMADMDPPNRLTLVGEGQGGVAGFAKGQAEVVLTPEDGGTNLTYTAKANVGGKLAQIGQRLIDGASKQIADEFFSRFAQKIAPAEAPAGVIAPAPETPAAQEDAHPQTVPDTQAHPSTPPPSVAEEPREGLAPEIWVVGLIAVIIILLVLFGVVL